MDTSRVHPHHHDDDTVEAHYACLERPCYCLEGWVFVGYLGYVREHGKNRVRNVREHSEEREAAYGAAAARIADSSAPINHAATKPTRVGVIGRIIALLG